MPIYKLFSKKYLKSAGDYRDRSSEMFKQYGGMTNFGHSMLERRRLSFCESFWLGREGGFQWFNF